MIDDKTAKDMLKHISLSGALETPEVNNIISSNGNHVLEFSSGLPKIRNSKKFSLILSIPEALKSLSSFEIRCCLCRKVISYPAWYLKEEFNINHFHFFVCFSSEKSVNSKCYRKG